MLKRILLGALGLLLLATLFVSFAFYRWRSEQVARLEGGSKVAQTAQGPIEYALTGAGERTLMFVHGTPGGYDQGKRLQRYAQEWGYRLLTVSRPGYLRTPLSTGVTPAAQGDAYAALLDTLGIDQVSIIGASGGGPSSAQLAARHPERCRALIMLSAVSKPRPPFDGTSSLLDWALTTDFGTWLVWRRVHADPAATLARRGADVADRIMADPQRLESYHALADSALVLISRRMPGVDNDRAQFVQMPEIPLARIRCPTLAVHGADDTTVPLEAAQHVVAQVPGAELVVVKGAGHLVSITHPEETFRPILQHLNRAEAPAGTAALP